MFTCFDVVKFRRAIYVYSPVILLIRFPISSCSWCLYIKNLNFRIIYPLYWSDHLIKNWIATWYKFYSLYKSVVMSEIYKCSLFFIIIFKINLSFELFIWWGDFSSPMETKETLSSFYMLICIIKRLSISFSFYDFLYDCIMYKIHTIICHLSFA